MNLKKSLIFFGLGFALLIGVLLLPALTKAAPEVADDVVPAVSQERSEGVNALDFAFEDINPKSKTFGQTVRLSDIYQERGVLLNFVASWCGPCRQELPILQSIHEDDSAAVVVVAADENGGGPENVKLVIKRAGATMPVLFTPTEQADELFDFYSYQTIPATYFINKDGKVKLWYTGMRSKKSLEKEIKNHLGL